MDHPHSAGTVHNTEQFWNDYPTLLNHPDSVVIGAMLGTSYFGQAHEFAFILAADLRRRTLRHKALLIYITSEPYITHWGLGGVGDCKALLETRFAATTSRGLPTPKPPR